MNTNCRESKDAYHVEIEINDEGDEINNLTHTGTDEDIDEVAWVIEAYGAAVVFHTLDSEGDGATLRLMPETALQLAHALTLAGNKAMANYNDAMRQIEAATLRDEQMKKNQGNLFEEATTNEP